MKPRLKKGDALLIIDAQNDFFPGGALPVAEGDSIISIINAWIEAAAQENVMIFASRDWHPINHCSFKEQGGPWPIHCVQDSNGAKIHSEIKLPEDCILIDTAADPQKEAYSAFQGFTQKGQPLNDTMKAKGIQRLWLTGLAQDFCVCESALEGRKNGYEVHLLIKGTKPIHEETGEDALQRMRAAGVIIEKDCNPYHSD
jgi:nicotinamidase/pyrazinamidase